MKDGFLINPVVVDARTEVTTQLLSEEGFIDTIVEETIGHEGMRIDRMFYQRSEETLRENDFITR